jgi:hypothetical protein
MMLTKAVADAGAVRPVTVRQWKRRGNIPSRYVPALIAAAEQRGIALSPADFFPSVASLDPAPSAAA